ncbi:MAG: PspA/IM30 family protein [Thermoanaerobaculia bacterium]|nr:PspA/IM30 family protein [Thermoanaerobaculia bacterium]
MFNRLKNLLRGFLSLFISGIEKANPRALIEAEKENLRSQIARFNDNLATHAGFIERLMRQISNQEKQEQDLAAKAAAHLKLGHRKPAGQYALQLKTVREQLEENRAQLQQAEATYKNLVQARDVSIREAKAKIEQLKRMISETEMMEAQAELQEMAQGMITQIGGSGDTLSRVEEYLTERRDKAAGRARVAQSSIDTTEVELMEAEQEALADQALVEFAAAYGLEMPAAEAAPAAEPTAEEAPTEVNKQMGPSVTEGES